MAGVTKASRAGVATFPVTLAVALDLRAFVIEEEEQTVAHDGTAEVAAVLIPPQRRARQAGFVGEEIIGIELVIAEELEERAVKCVGAGACGDVEDAAAGASVFGARRRSRWI